MAVSDTESTERDRDGLLAQFAEAVSSLADGGLTFKRPFDLSSSAALAANIDEGEQAQHLFLVTALRDVAYRVQIKAWAKDTGEREVLSTEVTSTNMLIMLLEGLLEELYARTDQE